MNFVRRFPGSGDVHHGFTFFFVNGAGKARPGPSAEIARPHPPARGPCPPGRRRAGRHALGCRGHRRRPALGGIAARRLARGPWQRHWQRRRRRWLLRRPCGPPRRGHGIGVVVPARTRSLWTGTRSLRPRSRTLDRGPRAQRQGCPVGHGGGFALGRPGCGPGRNQGACADRPAAPATGRRERRRDGSPAAPGRRQDAAGNGADTLAHRRRPRHRRRSPLAGRARALPRRQARGLACGVAQ